MPGLRSGCQCDRLKQKIVIELKMMTPPRLTVAFCVQCYEEPRQHNLEDSSYPCPLFRIRWGDNHFINRGYVNYVIDPCKLLESGTVCDEILCVVFWGYFWALYFMFIVYWPFQSFWAFFPLTNKEEKRVWEKNRWIDMCLRMLKICWWFGGEMSAIDNTETKP